MFVSIAERINATRKNIKAAIEARDSEAIRNEAVSQAEAGAVMIDINGGTRPEEERRNLDWLIGIVVPAVKKPLCVDSASPEALAFAAEKILELYGAQPPENGMTADGAPWLLLNSISGEKSRYDGVLPVAIKYNASVIALCMDDSGMPADAEKRIAAGRELVKRLAADGLPAERIFIDPLVMPVGVNNSLGPQLMKTVSALREEFPGSRITCGLSNVSHGLPARSLLNRTFLAMLIGAGLDSAILDPTDRRLAAALRAALVMSGRDSNCAGFLAAFRKKLLDA
jgi:cobalamin-dependent methionine synthase I